MPPLGVRGTSQSLGRDGAGGWGLVEADPPSIEVFRGYEGGAADECHAHARVGTVVTQQRARPL